MRVLIIEKYYEKFGDAKVAADIPSTVQLISEIQKSEFPDETFNSEKCKKQMLKIYKEKRITIIDVMETFLKWTK